MATLWNRIWNRSPRMATLSFTVYSRQGCGCCHKALDVLKGFQDRYPLRIEVVDVDDSDELKARYGMEVPVILLNGRVRFRGSVNSAMLERLLKAEAAAADPEKG